MNSSGSCPYTVSKRQVVSYENEKHFADLGVDSDLPRQSSRRKRRKTKRKAAASEVVKSGSVWSDACARALKRLQQSSKVYDISYLWMLRTKLEESGFFSCEGHTNMEENDMLKKGKPSKFSEQSQNSEMKQLEGEMKERGGQEPETNSGGWAVTDNFKQFTDNVSDENTLGSMQEKQTMKRKYRRTRGRKHRNRRGREKLKAAKLSTNEEKDKSSKFSEQSENSEMKQLGGEMKERGGQEPETNSGGWAVTDNFKQFTNNVGDENTLGSIQQKQTMKRKYRGTRGGKHRTRRGREKLKAAKLSTNEEGGGKTHSGINLVSESLISKKSKQGDEVATEPFEEYHSTAEIGVSQKDVGYKSSWGQINFEKPETISPICKQELGQSKKSCHNPNLSRVTPIQQAGLLNHLNSGPLWRGNAASQMMNPLQAISNPSPHISTETQSIRSLISQFPRSQMSSGCVQNNGLFPIPNGLLPLHALQHNSSCLEHFSPPIWPQQILNHMNLNQRSQQNSLLNLRLLQRCQLLQLKRMNISHMSQQNLSCNLSSLMQRGLQPQSNMVNINHMLQQNASFHSRLNSCLTLHGNNQ